MTYARVVIVLHLYSLEHCLNPVLQTLIKTRNFVTFYKFLIHLDVHHTNRINKKVTQLKHWLQICMSCIFGTSHQKPWWTKGSHGSICKESNDAPGKWVSINQMVFAQPELIPKMAGLLTNLHIWGATIFVDHFMEYVIWLVKSYQFFFVFEGVWKCKLAFYL